MDIAVTSSEIVKDDGGQPITTHMELDSTSMLSYVANLTPFSDFNQSPRNMYQCQVACPSWIHSLRRIHSLHYINSLRRIHSPLAGSTPFTRSTPSAASAFSAGSTPSGGRRTPLHLS